MTNLCYRSIFSDSVNRIGRRVWILLGFVTLSTIPAWAGSPPWATDWARTVAFRSFVSRLSFNSTYNETSRKTEIPRLQLSYGASPTTELIIRSSDIDVRKNLQDHRSISDTSLGVKHRFIDDSKAGVQIGASYFLSVPTGRPSVGTGTGTYDSTVSLLASKRCGSSQISMSSGANLYGRRSTNLTNGFVGLLLTEDTRNKDTVGIEVFATGPQKRNARADVASGIGIMHPINPSEMALLRIGHSFEGFSTLNVYIGFQKRF